MRRSQRPLPEPAASSARVTSSSVAPETSGECCRLLCGGDGDGPGFRSAVGCRPDDLGTVEGVAPESRSTMSATTTVTLSGAPARMASSTSRSAVAATGRPAESTSSMVSLATKPDRPSEQSRNRSPVRASRTMRSGSSPSLPVRTRVTRERCGWLSASSSVMRPSSTRDCTKEWSWVIWLNSPRRR